MNFTTDELATIELALRVYIKTNREDADENWQNDQISEICRRQIYRSEDIQDKILDYFKTLNSHIKG